MFGNLYSPLEFHNALWEGGDPIIRDSGPVNFPYSCGHRLNYMWIHNVLRHALSSRCSNYPEQSQSKVHCGLHPTFGVPRLWNPRSLDQIWEEREAVYAFPSPCTRRGGTWPKCSSSECLWVCPRQKDQRAWELSLKITERPISCVKNNLPSSCCTSIPWTSFQSFSDN